jgi:hypothetical protein
MRQAVQDWHNGKRGRAIKGFLKREWPVIAWLVSFTLIAIGIFQVSNFQENLRDATVGGCERQNEVREALRSQLTSEIRESQAVDSRKIFPNVPPEELQRLIRESNERLREQRARIPDADCQAIYPQ